ncbi:hypothetical protein QCA50_009414 [Cerrena zonata]|uniref:NmrA-like domain-containing protein n=1 Tax=Cerrena zonata TaxID=2478898 RepID=A0AAW0GBK7_9APHY
MSKPSVTVIGSAGLVVTRSAADKKDTATLKYVEADLGNETKLAEVLKGRDVIVSLASPSPEGNAVLEKVLTQVRPQVYIPSQFGSDLRPAQQKLPGFQTLKTDHADKVRAQGIKVVEVVTSYFIGEGHFLTEIVAHAGIDRDAGTVTYADSPQTKIAISYLPDVGNAVATLVSVDPLQMPDVFRMQSDEITYEDVAKKFENDHGVTLQVKHTTSDELLAKANEMMKVSQGFVLDEFLFYLWAVSAAGRDFGNSYSKNDNELVNPGGKLFPWTKFH